MGGNGMIWIRHFCIPLLPWSARVPRALLGVPPKRLSASENKRKAPPLLLSPSNPQPPHPQKPNRHAPSSASSAIQKIETIRSVCRHRHRDFLAYPVVSESIKHRYQQRHQIPFSGLVCPGGWTRMTMATAISKKSCMAVIPRIPQLSRSCVWRWSQYNKSSIINLNS
jgi:hypothetical protein